MHKLILPYKNLFFLLKSYFGKVYQNMIKKFVRVLVNCNTKILLQCFYNILYKREEA